MQPPDLSAITFITADSRRVKPGCLFAALPGTKADGRAFIAQAVAQGAAAVLAPTGTPWPAGTPSVPLILSDDPRAELARLAVRLAGPMPAHLAAVTGTNGKTSTVDFLRQLFTLSGHQAASLGTLGIIAPHRPVSESLTTPDPVTLANTLAELARSGVTHAALEASSHGLVQKRLDGLRFQAAGFTNLTRDHLDYHHTMAAYAEAKLGLFTRLMAPHGAVRVMAGLDAALRARLAGLAAGQGLDYAEIEIANLTPRPDGQSFTINGIEAELHLPGRFQAENAALAAALAQAMGVSNAIALLPRLAGVRGRLERALVLPNGATVYVDYAHTPDAIARVLQALRPHALGRLHILLGAGGDRDPGKRPLMGEAAVQGADHVIVTDDNPRSEDPALIRAAIMAAAPGAREIPGRREAIAAALAGLAAGDVLVVAGKGHEQGQIIKGEIIPFDDAAVIRELGGQP
ncbi:UDP-N-acetylmuramoyl-L-alanyl-D-glutamate--2,6-diaminopimelate ligase [Acidocella sp.]|uniref:UDP-N-acetylmuramoyl-L-alanyl-D-glutamate--2, 6-diaminopimelate ligase n=1 Tax=Acidocella sp. TaxID=50710 RepID=UPI0026226BA5|nr:UDP-N-acetylmuramoyl-L-alanyl-D-glutamate--2,6-diaminopimelate ligase [Acidocella sp.]